MLAFQARSSGSSSSKVSSLVGTQIQRNQGGDHFLGLKVGKSFVEVLRSSSCTAADTVGFQLLSLQVLDLFPVASCFEMGNARVELHSALNCYEMERDSLFVVSGGSCC